MPSADFCAAVRRPLDPLSRSSDTTQTSRGKTNSLPHPPPDLRFASLVDMDFAVDRPLVRRSRLVSGSCSSVHAFAPRFLQTPPHDDALALRYPFTSTRLGRGLSPPSCRSCPAHYLSRLRRSMIGSARDRSRTRRQRGIQRFLSLESGTGTGTGTGTKRRGIANQRSGLRCSPYQYLFANSLEARGDHSIFGTRPKRSER